MLIGSKAEFPIFHANEGLVYLDSAATTQRPNAVLDAIRVFDAEGNANVHRGLYELSSKATSNYEAVRGKVAEFIGASNANEIAFTKGTTEAVNIVARSFLNKKLNKGDNMVTTIMEHHANFIPWQMLAHENSIELRVVPVDSNGNLKMDQLRALVDRKTKMVAVNHISNTLGTVNEIAEIIAYAHQVGSPVLIDAAQSISYQSLNHQELKYDFLAFSGHKMFGPFGTGVLFAAEQHHRDISPYNYGGGMIKEVAVEGTSFSDFPFNMEAGTANISGVIGVGAAIEFIQKVGKLEIKQHVKDLTSYCARQLGEVQGVEVFGDPEERSGIVSFSVENIHPHDVASFLNQDHIAVRAGMHCTQPLLRTFDKIATVRASFSIYNNREEVDYLKEALVGLIKFWS